MTGKTKETLCMYNEQRMTVAEYLRKPEVKEFERQLRKLARQSALCQADGTSVYGGVYPPLREGFPTHIGRRCRYFETHVLPKDKRLEADYWNIMQGGKVEKSVMSGTCKRCERTFNKPARNTMYCDTCRNYREKERKRRYWHSKQ